MQRRIPCLRIHFAHGAKFNFVVDLHLFPAIKGSARNVGSHVCIIELTRRGRIRKFCPRSEPGPFFLLRNHHELPGSRLLTCFRIAENELNPINWQGFRRRCILLGKGQRATGKKGGSRNRLHAPMTYTLLCAWSVT